MLIRIKFESLETVHAPFDAYGSTKIAKKNQCVDSSPPFFIVNPFFSNFFFNEGAFLPSPFITDFTDAVPLQSIAPRLL